MKVYSFDLEQADPFPETGQPNYAELGITCISGLASDRLMQEKPLFFYAGMYQDSYQPRMDSFELAEAIEHLLEMTRQGYRLLTWNGASYDFRMLDENCPGYHDDLAEAMYNHIDMMFHFFAVKGFYLGLEKACLGQGIEGKIPDPNGGQMNGLKAVEYWPEQAGLVLDYVCQDAVAPILLFNKVIEQKGLLFWTANSGRPTSADLSLMGDFSWLSVRECLELPLPDTSWMSAPISREEHLAYWR